VSERRAKTRTPRTGRRPGVSGAREAILDAARTLFAEKGYTGTSLRAIAAEAGVDAALIVHYFGTKAGLLPEAIRWPFDPEVEMARISQSGRGEVGEALARLVVQTWDREGDRDAILTLLRAAMVEPAAAAVMKAFIEDELFPPLMRRLDVADGELRANLASSQLIGMGIARYVLQMQPLASMSEDEIVAWIAPTLQRYLAGD
jgi:AcrR family transcriptional regulator